MTAAVTRTSAAPAKMCVSPPVELVVHIAHRVRTTAPEHHLKIDRLEAFVLVAVNDTRWAGNTLPRPERPADPPPAFIFDKHSQIPLKDEEDLLDLVRMRRVTLSRWHIHDAEGKGARRDDRGVVVLAGPACADEAMLGAAVAVDLGVLEGFPITLLVAKATDVALGDLVERQAAISVGISCRALVIGLLPARFLRLARGFDELPNPRRRKRQLMRLYIERS